MRRPAFSTALTPAYGETWTTTAVRGLGGCSGGPLFVRRSNGFYFPAAIYLGGSGQTVVRAINSEVVELFNRAEVSGNGGNNNTDGGITHTSVTSFGNATVPGVLKVIIEPAAARTAGAGWRLKPESSYRLSGTQKTGLSPGTYIMQLTTVSGFQAPAPQSVIVTGGQLKEVTFTYLADPPRSNSGARPTSAPPPTPAPPPTAPTPTTTASRIYQNMPPPPIPTTRPTCSRCSPPKNRRGFHRHRVRQGGAHLCARTACQPGPRPVDGRRVPPARSPRTVRSF